MEFKDPTETFGVNRIHNLAILMRCCINSLRLLACILISKKKNKFNTNIFSHLPVTCLMSPPLH